MTLRPLTRRHVFALAAAAVVLASAWVFLLPLRGGTQVRLLVVPRSDAGDPGRAAATLVQVVESADFFTKVAAQDPQISWAAFGDADGERRARWQKTVSAKADHKTGLLTVTVRHRNQEQAGRIAQAAADVLTRRGGEYLPGTPQVVLLDPPLQQ